ncbi:hypothetical protein H2200_011670 [Cladophialophora chaetospira]|uniref:Heterokaryon incompatibility domain-containing protein n=1 Tax=Cladophialophora chaetospira TaxID=386627 RepID=A0AA39CDG1_9EURO|nr:hypothetical protein H2200_011670 [Cladophialophora chaetospira]
MEHLPRVADPALPPIKVPYLDKREWGDNTYASYPRLRGWDKERLLGGDFSQHGPRKTEEFLQTWLYFGMLKEVFAVKIDSRHFVRSNRLGERFITTKHLPIYTSELEIMFFKLLEDDPPPAHNEEQSSSERKVERHFIRAHACLSEVATLLNDYIIPLEDDGPLRGEILLSILVLGSSLSQMMLQLRDRLLDVKYIVGPYNFRITWPQSKLLKAYMLDAGWCPNEYERLAGTMAVPSVYYASSLQRSGRGNNHSRCSTERCIANNVDEEKYTTSHATEGCRCEHLEPSPEKLKAILEDGGHPLIQISIRETPLECDIDVVDSRAVSKYVALSHVWSDGLGNTIRNSLPKCQLIRLRTVVEASYGHYGEPANSSFDKGMSWMKQMACKFSTPVPIWIDTLCVPLERKLRKLAISRLRQTYLEANRVLVLDAELQRSPFNSLAEALMRLNCSGWLRRLWTLQEGILARSNLYIQFSDRVVNLKKASEDLLVQASLGPLLCHPIFEDICATALRKAVILDSNVQWCSKIVRLWEMLCWRTSTRDGDSPIVLASLLGIDTFELQGIPVDQRMKAIYSSLNVFPQAILFVSGKRIREEGMTWAPAGFQKPTDALLRNIAPGYPTDRGLLVTYPGLLFLPEMRPQHEVFPIFDIDGMQSFTINPEIEEDTPPWEAMRSLKNLAIIVKPTDGDMITTGNVTDWRNGLNTEAHLWGVLVSIYGEDRRAKAGSSVLYARYQCRVRISNAADVGDVKDHTNPVDFADLAGQPEQGVRARSRPSNQRWCIG